MTRRRRTLLDLVKAIMPKKKQRRTFKGIDWMELIKYWNLKVRKAKVNEYMEENPEVPDFEAWDKVAVDRARDYAHDAIIAGGPRLKEVAEDARAFLRALAKSSEKLDYHAPVWRGMLAIKNDAGGNETLLKFVCYLEAVAMTIHVAKRVQTLQYLEVSIYLDCMWT